MIILGGVDPGLTGAAVSIDASTPLPRILHVLDFQEYIDESGTCLDAVRLAPHLAQLFEHALFITIERPGAMPANQGQGVTSAFNFGQSCGIAYGLCAAVSQAKVRRPHPAVWKAAMGATADKKLCTALAADIFRQRDIFYGPRGGCRDGRAEAALLAYFGQRFVSRLLF